MTQDVDAAARRGAQYWYDDGLTEIAAGCLFVALGILFLVEGTAPAGSLRGRFSSVALVVLVAGGMWVARRAVAAAKARITYPRTGYVRYRRQPRTMRRRLLAMALGALVSGSVVLTLRVAGPASLAWIPTLQGMLIGCFLLYTGYAVGVTRFYALAAASILIGLSASVMGLGDTLGSSAYFAALGLLLLLSGGVALWSYLRGSGLPEGE